MGHIIMLLFYYFIVCGFVAVETSAKESKMKVMSWNIRYQNDQDGVHSWDERRGIFMESLERHRPQVAGLQEVLKEQLEDIKLDLDQGRYGVVGRGRFDGNSIGEFSPIVYDRAMFERESDGQFWLSDTPDTPSLNFDSSLPRICTWIMLRHKESSRRFFFLNTHWDHASQRSRVKSAKLILDFIQTIDDLDELTVMLLGDMNAGEDSAEIALVKKGGFRDTFRLRRASESVVGTLHRFQGNVNGEKIDYIFIKPQKNMEGAKAALNLIDANIIRERYDDEKWPSDHFPVVAEFTFVPARRKASSMQASGSTKATSPPRHLYHESLMILALIFSCFSQ